VNLGQALGELQLRVWELEEQLSKQPSATPSTAPRIMQRVRLLLTRRESMTIDEMAEELVDVKRTRIAATIQTSAAQGYLTRRGTGMSARYALPARKEMEAC